MVDQNTLADRVFELERIIRDMQAVKIETPEVDFGQETDFDYIDLGCIKFRRGEEVTYNLVTVTDTYTALRNDRYIIADPATAKTITIPTSDIGKTYTIKNVSASVITVDGGDYNIDGAATQSLATQYEWITIVFDGTEWDIVGQG